MIQIDKISKNYKNYKYKIFISFFLFSIIVISTIVIVHIVFTKENNNKKFLIESQLQIKEKKIFLNSFLQKQIDSILAVKDNPYFSEFVENSMYEHNTAFLFFTIMQENKHYMQMRFLDNNGQEIIRFDRKFYGQVAYKVATLQNKQNRYYFQQSKKIKENDIFFSKIDFNKEFGKVQKPYIPVLRVATPVYIKKTLKGILVINIFIKKFMQQFTSSAIYNIILVNKDGYIIKKKDKYYDNTIKLKKFYPQDIVKQILNTKDFLVLNQYNIYVQKINIGHQSIYIILKSKNRMLNEIRKDDIKMTIIILFITSLLSIPFAFILSRPIKDMVEILLYKSDKLHELATTLDKKVEEQTLQNAKQDRLIQHQAKMAELGDMIGNIAHQWRHPLTRLSLLLQNLKLYKKKNKLNDDILYDIIEKANKQIEFMSSTIDNFKEFYKTDKTKEYFTIKNSLDDILNIIGSVIEHSNIALNITGDQTIKIYGIKNQFSQVLLNLIVNAKDAIEENNIDNGYIDISIKNIDNKLIIEIKDNGKGINKDILKDIFEPYFTTKKDKGTGIGLYLCKTIIEDEMQGILKVKNIDNGVLFKIVLFVKNKNYNLSNSL